MAPKLYVNPFKLICPAPSIGDWPNLLTRSPPLILMIIIIVLTATFTMLRCESWPHTHTATVTAKIYLIYGMRIVAGSRPYIVWISPLPLIVSPLEYGSGSVHAGHDRFLFCARTFLRGGQWWPWPPRNVVAPFVAPKLYVKCKNGLLFPSFATNMPP